MKILVLGSGGREHTLVWALARRGHHELHAAPGNPGMASLATLHPLQILNKEDVVGLAKNVGAHLVVVGPEAPLVAGIADRLRAEGFAVFGPGASGARLEGSKSFAKKFMERHGIPTAPFAVCTSLGETRDALERRTPPFVIKADGLAAGKGAFLPETREEADRVCRNLLERRMLQEAGKTVVVEDYLPGWEMTILALFDGQTLRLLPPSQDHKRIFDGDKGPNTGGMGAYTPVPQADTPLLEKITARILEPTARGLREEGISFCGVLYVGIMVVREEPHVVEYNVRFGDPETQVVLPALDVDWAETFLACAQGRLVSCAWPTDLPQATVGVVLASEGYPGSYETGHVISGLDSLEGRDDVLVFHSGTSRTSSGQLATAGGRVLTVVGRGVGLEDALAKAYEGVKHVSFQDMCFRRDIAARALQHRPKVGILLGSASDLPLAQEAADIFRALEIPFEVSVASAHRTPAHVSAYAASAQERGLSVLIAVAGLSAALPGVVASHTLLPVLGVPVASGSLGGVDALLSVAQMPPGVPVGSLGIGGGRNAALLAARILALHQPELATRLQLWNHEASAKVLASREKLGDLPQPPADAFSRSTQEIAR